MGPMHPNIVQAEFFHIGGKENQQLGELMAEAQEWIQTAVSAILEGVPPSIVGARIKTVVRFFDEDGSLTRYVAEHTALEDAYDRLLMGFPEKSTSWWGIWHRLRFLSVAKKKRRHDLLRHRVVFAALKAAVRGRQPVAGSS